MNIYADNALGHILTKRITPYLNKQGHKFSENPLECNVQLSFVRAGWKGNLPIVQRIDGIYYSSVEDYQTRNLAISKTHQIASGVIYQSEYSKKLCEHLLLQRNTKAKVSVIYNGIEPNWCGPHIEHDGINIVVLGKHRRHKRLKEIIDLFIDYNNVVNDSTLHIFGLLHNNTPVIHPNIKYYGMVEREKMIDVMRISDMSIHLSKRDSCPNSVVECISAGIPVITTNNCGGATEMCRMTPGCIIIEQDGDYNDLKTVDYYGEQWNKVKPEVQIALLYAMVSITNDKRRVILPKELHAEYTADKYIEIMKGVL